MRSVQLILFICREEVLKPDNKYRRSAINGGVNQQATAGSHPPSILRVSATSVHLFLFASLLHAFYRTMEHYDVNPEPVSCNDEISPRAMSSPHQPFLPP